MKHFRHVVAAKYAFLVSLLVFWDTTNAFLTAGRGTTSFPRIQSRIRGWLTPSITDVGAPYHASRNGQDRRVSLSRLGSRKDKGRDELLSNDDQSLLVQAAGWIAYLFVVSSCLATAWSLVSILQTGCGPLYLPDTLERISYQTVIALFSVSWFLRLAFQQDAVDWLLDLDLSSLSSPPTRNRGNASSLEATRFLLQGAQILIYGIVFGSVVVLLNQVVNNVDVLDGFSGIDEAACQARLSFRQEMLFK